MNQVVKIGKQILRQIMIEALGRFKFFKFLLTAFIFGFLNPSLVWSNGNSDIQVRVSNSNPSVGEVFTISAVINIVGNFQPVVSMHEFPSDPKISFLSESQGFSMQQVVRNGVASISKTITLNMFYRALAKGNVKVSSIKLKINDKIAVVDKGFELNIIEGSNQNPRSNLGRNSQPNQRANPRQNRGQGRDLLEDVFNSFFNGDTFGNPKKGQTGELDFFVDVEVSNMNPYYSEQFVAKWYLYTNGRVTDIDTLKYPALEGFWKDEISLATSLAAEEVQKNGRNFTRYLLASYALTPIVKDKAYIDPYEVKCQLIGNIFSFGAKELVRTSDEALVRIKPLPVIKPDDFTGAVGDFKVTSYVKDQAFKVGQPFEFFVRLSGEGQLKFMELPALGLSEDEITVYDTSEESQFKPPLSSVKTYKILLVPQKEGSLELPELSMSFFDPVSAKFYNIKTRAIGINVAAADEVQQDIVTAKDADLTTRFKPTLYDRFSKSSASFGSISSSQSLGIVFFSLFLSIGLLLHRYFSLQIKYDFKKDLAERFQKLMAYIERDEWREASKMAVNIVYFYANAKANKRPRTQKLEDILDVLPAGLRRSVELSMTNLNADLQKYSFAPSNLIESSRAKDKVLEKCLALKELLERSSLDEAKNESEI